MKKKLLITLGCSYTEGVGCYEPSLLDSSGNPLSTTDLVYTKSFERFHTLGWPAQLQKKLQYDYLWNIGHGGASTSETVKRWMELFSNRNLSDEYDVLVVWMVTFAERISFYRNGNITSINNNTQRDVCKSLYQSYIKFIENNKDMLLETYFYVNIIQNICNLADYKFLYINVNNTDGIILDSLMKSPNSLNFVYKKLYPKNGSILDVSPGSKSFCGHPNERGYEIIAETLFNLISYDHQHLINKKTPTEYKIEYLGNPKFW